MHMQASLRAPDQVVADLAAALHCEESPEQISWSDSRHWQVHLASLGDLPATAVTEVTELLTERVAELPAPTLRVAGVWALPDDDNPYVWAFLDGATSDTQALARQIPAWLYELGFLIDRRSFRPRIRLGRVNARTTLAYLHAMNERMRAYRGPQWTPETVCIGRPIDGGYRVVSELPFGTALADGARSYSDEPRLRLVAGSAVDSTATALSG